MELLLQLEQLLARERRPTPPGLIAASADAALTLPTARPQPRYDCGRGHPVRVAAVPPRGRVRPRCVVVAQHQVVVVVRVGTTALKVVCEQIKLIW